jgi:hypothetical protein
MVSVSLAAAEPDALGIVSDLAPEPALREAVSFLPRLLRGPAFLDEYVLPLPREADGWYVARDETAIPAHFYGPKVGEVDGHDYDASRAYVCDRADA